MWATTHLLCVLRRVFCRVGESLESALCFLWQLSWAGAAAWQPLLFRAASQKHPYKCYCAHLIDLSEAEKARQADFGGEWRGMAGEQTSDPVSAAEEVGPQVARRRAWIGERALIRCQQWYFLTMALHKQASEQRWSVLREWRTAFWVAFTAHTGKGGSIRGRMH